TRRFEVRDTRGLQTSGTAMKSAKKEHEQLGREGYAESLEVFDLAHTASSRAPDNRPPSRRSASSRGARSCHACRARRSTRMARASFGARRANRNLVGGRQPRLAPEKVSGCTPAGAELSGMKLAFSTAPDTASPLPEATPVSWRGSCWSE